MSDTIKFQIAVGVTHGGGWCVADSGDSVPLNIEHAIDRVWEDISGDASFGNGYEIYVIDIELPRPVRHDPPRAEPSAVTPAIRVDSKDAILRGRFEALVRVLKMCELDDSATAKVRELMSCVDEDWSEADG